jgi:hypothetical protein
MIQAQNVTKLRVRKFAKVFEKSDQNEWKNTICKSKK